MYTTSDLRKGLKIEIDGSPWIITAFDFNKPGKGQSIYKCKLRNMINGSGMDRSYRSGEKFEKPNLFERKMFFSYLEGEFYVFTDMETYEETRVNQDTLGHLTHFIVEDMECTILFFNDTPVEVEIPTFISKEITWTEPGARGDTTSTNVLKPAKIDTGFEVNVPLFINEGDLIKIDTRTGEYVERVKK